MRILLTTDMEGVSQITDHRQCWPAFPEYWREGRTLYTAEVAAVAAGLLEGGASSVGIADTHGNGNWHNLLLARLPAAVELVDLHARHDGYDASFQLGMHPRCGTLDGFMSHTHLPNFRMALDGALITECHEFAWDAGLPLLGVSGEAALERELDGGLSGTPFLAVKRSTSRAETTPSFDPAGSAEALREFARTSVLNWKERPAVRPPETFTLEMSLNPDVIPYIKPASGLTRESAAVVSLTGTAWLQDAQPAIRAAFSAALRPWIAALDGVKLSSEETMLQQDPHKLERFREYLDNWMTGQDEAWVV